MNENIFRDLGNTEEQEFRDHARKEYKPISPINSMWHPIYREECVKINKEHYANLQDKLTVLEVYGYVRLKDGTEIQLEGKNSVKKYLSLNPDDIVSFGVEDVGDEANHYLVIKNDQNLTLTTLEEIQLFIKENYYK